VEITGFDIFKKRINGFTCIPVNRLKAHGPISFGIQKKLSKIKTFRQSIGFSKLILEIKKQQ
jgi:hypothetical protein